MAYAMPSGSRNVLVGTHGTALQHKKYKDKGPAGAKAGEPVPSFRAADRTRDGVAAIGGKSIKAALRAAYEEEDESSQYYFAAFRSRHRTAHTILDCTHR